MLVRADEAMRVEHALQHRAALRNAGPQWNDTEGPVRTTADEPTLRETALCLQPTGELLRRLGDLHMALRGRHVAPHDTGAAPDERLRACRARYKQQADAITRILRKRGIAMR